MRASRGWHCPAVARSRHMPCAACLLPPPPPPAGLLLPPACRLPVAAAAVPAICMPAPTNPNHMPCVPLHAPTTANGPYEWDGGRGSTEGEARDEGAGVRGWPHGQSAARGPPATRGPPAAPPIVTSWPVSRGPVLRGAVSREPEAAADASAAQASRATAADWRRVGTMASSEYAGRNFGGCKRGEPRAARTSWYWPPHPAATWPGRHLARGLHRGVRAHANACERSRARPRKRPRPRQAPAAAAPAISAKVSQV